MGEYSRNAFENRLDDLNARLVDVESAGEVFGVLEACRCEVKVMYHVVVSGALLETNIHPSVQSARCTGSFRCSHSSLDTSCHDTEASSMKRIGSVR